MSDPVLRILKSDPRAKLPYYAHPGDAGADLSALLPEDQEVLILESGARARIQTGLQFDIPDGYEVQIRPRSGLALKHGITVLNSPGTIDQGYRGPITVLLVNHGSEPFPIRTGDRIAQMVLAPVIRGVISEVTAFENETARGAGGFGSTGAR